MFPLKDWGGIIHTSDKPGGFGFKRTHDHHTGIDLYCNEYDKVYVMRNCKIINILPFTGKDAGSPWWEDTWAIMVEEEHYVGDGNILYGEITPNHLLKIGDSLLEGDLLGTVKRVLKKDKGLPMDMLHMEYYDRGTIEPVWWYLEQDKPSELRDPYGILNHERMCDSFWNQDDY